MNPIQFPLPAGTPNPLPFKKALRMLIGGRHVDERQHILRGFLEANRVKCLRAGHQNLPEIEEQIASYKSSGVSFQTLYLWNELIPEWRKQNQTEKNRQNALRRWRKPQAKKRPLDRPQKRPK